MRRQPLDLIRFRKHPEGAPIVTENGSCPSTHSHQIGEKVRRCVSDLSSLLGLIVTMRNGMDDLPPRTHAEIAQILEASLPHQAREELAKTLNRTLEQTRIDAQLIEELETQALRQLTGRK